MKGCAFGGQRPELIFMSIVEKERRALRAHGLRQVGQK